jgi:hypothetical protein
MSCPSSPIFKMDHDDGFPKTCSGFVMGLVEKSNDTQKTNEILKKTLFHEYEYLYTNSICSACQHRAGLGLRDAYINLNRQDFIKGLGKPEILCEEFLRSLRLLNGMKKIEVWNNKAFTVYFKW